LTTHGVGRPPPSSTTSPPFQVIFFTLSFAKIFFGYTEEDAPYQQIESGAPGGVGAARLHGQADDLATRHLEQARRDAESAGMLAGKSEALPSARSSYSSRYVSCTV
jgi:hypothetical protein